MDDNECFANYEVTPKPPCKVPFKVHTNSITGGCKPDAATEADLIWIKKVIPGSTKELVFPCTINNGKFQTTACHIWYSTLYTLDDNCGLVSKVIPEDKYFDDFSLNDGVLTIHRNDGFTKSVNVVSKNYIREFVPITSNTRIISGNFAVGQTDTVSYTLPSTIPDEALEVMFDVYVEIEQNVIFSSSNAVTTSINSIIVNEVQASSFNDFIPDVSNYTNPRVPFLRTSTFNFVSETDVVGSPALIFYYAILRGYTIIKEFNV